MLAGKMATSIATISQAAMLLVAIGMSMTAKTISQAPLM